ncbi:hypothetical protein MACH21_11240 [Roseicyclus marinus]|uniref:Uncharacterized protein n=1 Tax=Roseicyclus marinus TaxID=2161673 RepID=A0AA48H416_9RHOB|nr:hypothetical protein MACH21_11240 [Roseicyclus marinus]
MNLGPGTALLACALVLAGCRHEEAACAAALISELETAHAQTVAAGQAAEDAMDRYRLFLTQVLIQGDIERVEMLLQSRATDVCDFSVVNRRLRRD